jgi:hypothetical protein
MQVEALSDRMLVAFKEASLDLGKLLAAKGLAAVSLANCVVCTTAAAVAGSVFGAG